MATPKQIALAYTGLQRLIFNDPSYISSPDLLIMINNELDFDFKFLSEQELIHFYNAAARDDFRLKHLGQRISALKEVLDRLWLSLNSEIIQLEQTDPLIEYYQQHDREFTEFPKSDVQKNEEIQFSRLRQEWLNQAQEQIIFNYEPAEIGPDNDQRVKKLRRDLVTNLGLVGFPDRESLDDLRQNQEVKCNYVFVVPDHDKAKMLWIGIVKELCKSLFEIVNITESLKLSNNDIFNLALEKITQLYSNEYTIKGSSIFDEQGYKYPELKPICVFVASPEYCWAPTVVATKSERDDDKAGFVMFRDEDIGVAQMTKKAISIWCSSILSIFYYTNQKEREPKECVAEIVHWSEEIAKSKKTDILSSIW